MKQNLYIGTYTSKADGSGHRELSVYGYAMDAGSGALQRVRAIAAGPNPSFLALSRDGSRLYAVNELADGMASSFAIDSESGDARLLNQQPVQGADPAYVSLDPDERWLLAACYSSGNLSVLPILEDGRLGALAERVQHDGSGPNKQRQEQAHAHFIRFDPSNRFVFAVDLGMDRVWVYRFDAQTGKLQPNDPPGLDVHAGGGPRHLAYHPNDRFVYIANELDSTVTTCAWDSQSSTLRELQILPTVPEYFDPQNTVADIHFTPDGRYLYVSNRGEDSLAAYYVDGGSGMLHSIGFFPCGGQWPRNFAVHPDGRFLLVANQKSDNLVVFRIAEDGRLTPTGEEDSVPSPVCAIFA